MTDYGSSIRWYGRDGQPLAEGDRERLLSDRTYRVVAQTTLANGWFVSTVWLGLDHGYGAGPPLIFETMIFDRAADGGFGRGDSVYQERYATEAEALAGHAHACDLDWHALRALADEA